jgi:hypothetical protein
LETRACRNNELRSLEVQLCQSLLDRGRGDLADAVRGGRKWHRLDDLLGGHIPEHEGAVGLRLAFNPAAQFPSSKDEWIKEGMAKYADDEALLSIAESWQAWQKKLAEDAQKASEPVLAKGEEQSRKTEATLEMSVRRGQDRKDRQRLRLWCKRVVRALSCNMISL